MIHKLKVKLKQHTPLIHFQHSQSGATLRATEVKPKLDRYILKKLSNSNKYKELAIDYLTKSLRNKSELEVESEYSKRPGYYQALAKGWLVGNGEHSALNYKMRITPLSEPSMREINSRKIWQNNSNRQYEVCSVDQRKYEVGFSRNYGRNIFSLRTSPLFFANMDKDWTDDDEIKKYSIAVGGLEMVLTSSSNTMIDLVSKSIDSFFVQTNFGTRQSKGFGGFQVIHEEPIKNVFPNTKLFFDLNCNQNNMFRQLDMFYKSIRSGINLSNTKNEQGGNVKFYFKSVMFLYALKHFDMQWEKKTIKENFFNNFHYNTNLGKGLECQQKEYKDDGESPLYYANRNKAVFKDLLGLSTIELWGYYRTTISKAQSDNTGTRKQDERRADFSRIPSPLKFKIYELEANKYRVYTLIDDEVCKEVNNNVLGKTLLVDNSQNDRHRRSFTISFPGEFDYSDFLRFVANLDLESHIDATSQTSVLFIELRNIYNQLKTNTKK